MKNTFKLLSFLLITTLCLTSCVAQTKPSVSGTNSAEITTVPSHEIVQEITSTAYDFTFKDSHFDSSPRYEETIIALHGTSADCTSTNVEQNDSCITIKAEGTYLLSGSYQGQLVIDADKEKVQIILNNAAIDSSTGPAIFVRSADKVTITLSPDTTNTLNDSTEIVIEDQEELDAVIYSKDDLVINGSGALNITAKAKHGIVSKDDLIICSSDIQITAPGAGLIGKDCVKICESTLDISAGADAIRSSKSGDPSLGYIYMINSLLTVDAGNDALQAETAIGLENNQFEIKAGSGSSVSLSSSSESFKGLKAGSEIILASGSYTIDSQDDCIHSNGTIQISGGTYLLSSGDDGIHADTSLTISGGTIDITKSYEGIESSSLELLGGTVSIIASDDGLNGAGGNDSSASGDRFGRGPFSSSTGTISIQGGYFYIDSKGDGIDTNGSITITGGTVLIAGPSDNNNAALDYDVDATITGGIIIALGGSGMAQNFTNAENQGAILKTFNNTSESFALIDENDQVIASLSTEKPYSCALVSTPEIREGATYVLVFGAEIDDADEHGFAQNTSYTGGTIADSISVDSLISGNSFGFGGEMGKRGEFNGHMPEGMQRPQEFPRGDKNQNALGDGMTPPDSGFIPDRDFPKSKPFIPQ